MNALLVSMAFMLLAVAVVTADQKGYMIRTGKKYLEEQAAKEGAYKLESGMVIEILKESDKDGAKSPNKGDSCECTYEGTFKDGKRFDGGTTSFAPNQVIKGWTQAMQLMVEGDKWRLHIPYDLAYGERGSPPRIPGYSVLVFELEVPKVKGKGKSKEEARKAFQDALAAGGDL